jgi:hypothetical protein
MAQTLVEGGRPEASLDRAVDAVRQAAAGGRRLALPECLDVGWIDPSTPDLAQLSPGPHSERLAHNARAPRVPVAAGLVERADDSVSAPGNAGGRPKRGG